MNEFVYPIKEVFRKLLTDNNTIGFYIAPYQRGYKWASYNVYDQVPRMLIDFYDAFRKNNKEYYLQYLTLMRKKSNGKYVFEVIDGQQRLTTLSILLYCYGKMFNRENIAANLLNYSRYKDGNIFDEIMTFVKDQPSAEADEEIKSQDRFYMTKAARCITKFFQLLEDEGELEGYLSFVLNNVKLIINLESEFVKPEEVFSNLNDNKVELTNAELIKGLLLTLASRTDNGLNVKRSYTDILNQRAVMGREWDEISAWIEKPAICRYFFCQEPGKGERDRNKGLEHLLELIELQKVDHESALMENFVKYLDSSLADDNVLKSRTELFDRFNESIDTPEKAREALSQLKHIYNVLHDIYTNKDFTLYNLLGYYFFAEPKKKLSEREQFIKELLQISGNRRIEFLKEKILLFYPVLPQLEETEKAEEKEALQRKYDEAMMQFRYASYNPKLTNLLLSFSVFPEEGNATSRFDFYSYDREKWSFEHIFPQHPSKDEVAIKEDVREIVCAEIVRKQTKDGKEKSASTEIKSILEEIRKKGKLKIDPRTEFLYSSDIEDVHVLGNMALLSGGVNSALSNNPFIAKRPILSNKNKAGKFIPYHTVGIFNKLFASSKHPFNIELTLWDTNDVEAHAQWMIERNHKIIELLAPTKK